MSILNKSFKIDFTQVPNHIINNKEVSASSKFLYVYMVSKPDKWDFSINGIKSQLKESHTTILRMIDELVRFGYMDKIKTRLNGRQGVSEYILHLEPQLRSDSRNENQKNRISNTESVNDTTSNTISSNTKKEILTKSYLSEDKQGVDLKSIKEKNNFKRWKKQFIFDNKDKFFFVSPGLGFLHTTPFKIKDNLVYNTVAKKTITKDESFKIWDYLHIAV